MAETAILEEIRSFVSDRLQVVSYKWLSRNFLVSSNAAKRLLNEFVEKYGDGLVVIYSLSGWLKKNTTYHIRLVTKHMLSDAKQEFDGNCSVQVYSVQACLPKDPATLWNHEFVQAEDLFKQPSSGDNCLRDNRFCGVSNSFVKRSSGETHLGNGSAQLKSAPQTTAAPQSLKKNVQSLQSPSIAKPVKTEGEMVAGKEKVPRLLPNNKKAQSDKNSSGTGGALASMWGHSSAKSKHDASLVQADNSIQKSFVSAEAQICARESVECESSDDDDKGFSIKRASNGESRRKRRVLAYLDEEDDYENAISLGSPDPPKKSPLCSKDESKTSAPECNSSFEKKLNKPMVKEEKGNSKATTPECNLSFEKKENKPKVKEEKESGANANQHLGEKVKTVNNSKKAASSISANTLCHVPEADAGKKDTVADAVPKRRKVLKTQIDERGREVTTVVWEGEEQDSKSENNSAKTAENNTASNAINRPPVVRKSPAVGNTGPANQTGKAGNKKAANKDPKQGNLFSFFKKV